MRTRRSLVRSAVALWRVNGYEDTTVEDICRAAGVSKGLFYFYFERKEDVLDEVGAVSSAALLREATAAVEVIDDLDELLHSLLTSFERSMLRNPRSLVLAVILEGYRHPRPYEPLSLTAAFMAVFERARERGQLRSDTDAPLLADLAHMVLTEAARTWSLGHIDDTEFVAETKRRLDAVLAGARVSGKATGAEALSRAQGRTEPASEALRASTTRRRARRHAAAPSAGRSPDER